MTLQRLRHLELSGCGIGPSGARALADCFKKGGCPELRTLDCTANHIGKSGIKAFLSNLRREPLLKIRVTRQFHNTSYLVPTLVVCLQLCILLPIFFLAAPSARTRQPTVPLIFSHVSSLPSNQLFPYIYSQCSAPRRHAYSFKSVLSPLSLIISPRYLEAAPPEFTPYYVDKHLFSLRGEIAKTCYQVRRACTLFENLGWNQHSRELFLAESLKELWPEFIDSCLDDTPLGDRVFLDLRHMLSEADEIILQAQDMGRREVRDVIWAFERRKASIKRLDLSWNNLGAGGVKGILTALYNNDSPVCLGALELNYVDMELKGARAVAQYLKVMAMRRCFSLTSLSLAGNQLGPQGIWDIAIALDFAGPKFCGNITRLNLSKNQMSDDALSELLHGLKRAQCLAIEELDLSKNAIGPKGALRLALAISDGLFPRLKRLDLGYNQISMEGIGDILSSFMVKTWEQKSLLSLVSLDLSYSQPQTGEEDCFNLWAGQERKGSNETWWAIQSLNLQGNNLGPCWSKFLNTFMNFQAFPYLEVLDIRDSQIGDELYAADRAHGFSLRATKDLCIFDDHKYCLGNSELLDAWKHSPTMSCRIHGSSFSDCTPPEGRRGMFDQLSPYVHALAVPGISPRRNLRILELPRLLSSLSDSFPNHSDNIHEGLTIAWDWAEDV